MGSVIRRENTPAGTVFAFPDVEHEARQILTQARAQAEQLAAETRARIAAAERQAATLIEARQREAYERGLDEGRRAGRDEVRRESIAAALLEARDEIARLVQALARGVAEYERSRHRLMAEAEAGLIELALAVARRVCKHDVAQSTAAARANVRALLELVKPHSALEVRLHPDDLERLGAGAQTFPGLAGDLAQIAFIPDAAVERGGCVLRSRAGTIDASITVQLDRIAAALRPDEAVTPEDDA